MSSGRPKRTLTRPDLLGTFVDSSEIDRLLPSRSSSLESTSPSYNPARTSKRLPSRQPFIPKSDKLPPPSKQRSRPEVLEPRILNGKESDVTRTSTAVRSRVTSGVKDIKGKGKAEEPQETDLNETIASSRISASKSKAVESAGDTDSSRTGAGRSRTRGDVGGGAAGEEEAEDREEEPEDGEDESGGEEEGSERDTIAKAIQECSTLAEFEALFEQKQEEKRLGWFTHLSRPSNADPKQLIRVSHHQVTVRSSAIGISSQFLRRFSVHNANHKWCARSQFAYNTDLPCGQVKKSAWIIGILLCLEVETTAELKAALDSDFLKSFMQTSDDDETIAAKAIAQFTKWRKKNLHLALENNLFDKFLAMYMLDELDQGTAAMEEFPDGSSFVCLAGGGIGFANSRECKTNNDYFLKHVAKPALVQLWRLLLVEFADVPPAPPTTPRLMPLAPFRFPLAVTENGTSLQLPSWCPRSEGKRPPKFTLYHGIDVEEPTPLEDRIVGFFSTPEGSPSPAWEADLDRYISSCTRATTRERASASRGRLLTVLSYANSLLKDVKKTSWTTPEEVELNDDLLERLKLRFPNPNAMNRAYYGALYVQHSDARIWRGWRVLKEENALPVVREVPSLARAKAASRITTSGWEISKNIPMSDQIAKRLALETIEFVEVDTDEDETNLDCYDCHGAQIDDENFTFLRATIEEQQFTICTSCYEGYLVSAAKSEDPREMFSGQDFSFSLMNAQKREGLSSPPITMDTIRKEMGSKKGVDFFDPNVNEVPEEYFGFSQLKIRAGTDFTRAMSSGDCIHPRLPDAAGTKFIKHTDLDNIAFTSWPLNAMLAQAPRQLAPLLATVITLVTVQRHLSDSADTRSKLIDDVDILLPDILSTIDQIYDASVLLRSTRGGNASPTKMFGKTPLAGFLASLRISDNLLAKSIAPDSSALPGSEAHARNTFKWLKNVADEDIVGAVSTLEKRVSDIPPRRMWRQGWKTTVEVSDAEWNRIYKIVLEIESQLIQNSNSQGFERFGRCSEDEDCPSILNPQEQEEFERTMETKWTMERQSVFLCHRLDRLLFACDKNYQTHEDADAVEGRRGNAIIAMFYAVGSTNWSDMFFGRLSLLKEDSFFLGGFGHRIPGGPMRSGALIDKPKSIDDFNFEKSNICFRSFKSTRQLVSHVQDGRDDSNNSSKQANFRLFVPPVIHNLKHGRYKKLPRDCQELLAKEVETLYKDGTIRWDRVPRDAGFFPGSGKITYRDSFDKS